MTASVESSPASRRRGFRLLPRLAGLFRPHGRTLALSGLLLAVTTAAQLLGPLLIRHAIDVDIRHGDFPGLLGTVGLYVVVHAVFLVFNYLQKVRLERMGQDIIFSLRKRLISHLLSQSMSFFDRTPVGRLIARVQGDTDALRQMFSMTVVAVVEALMLFVGMIVVMALVSPPLTLVVVCLVPAVILLAWILVPIGARRYAVVRERAADLAAFVAERIQGMSVIQAFRREDVSVTQMDRLAREKFRASFRAEWVEVGLFQAVIYLQMLAVVLVLWFGGGWVLAGTLTIGTLFMFIDYLRRLIDPLIRISEQLDVIQRAMAAGGRVFDLLDMRPRVEDPSSPLSMSGRHAAVEFRDVAFSYREDGEYALRDVSFRIPPGQTWAIVGATGAGKSSVFNLLLRFYDPQSGSVLLDGTDIRRVRQRDLRARMGLVLQDATLFPGDILSNLAPDGVVGPGTESICREAARVVGADRFIDGLPEGFSTPLAERGANLSAGQRQLLSLARALVADPEILLLDEATAAVDPKSEAEIQAAMRALLAGRTAIVIAHRLSTIRHADMILVLKEGRLVERGRHEALLPAGGVYAALHALQFQGPEERPEAIS